MNLFLQLIGELRGDDGVENRQTNAHRVSSFSYQNYSLLKDRKTIMSLIRKSTGAALAIAAAGMIGCASYSSSDKSASAPDNVHCYGVNKCKGHNDCKTASNACKGHASCKGQGFVGLSASACDHVGGKPGA